uniref:Uncharacterized protein n=1 Tax=Avena sativa TaxID=4498 RepID=A0ACD5VFD7_AVESA
MKLLVDTQAQRVLFAEASKDVVDFLFSLLALPVGTAVKLLGKESMVGCVGSLYSSVEKLDGTYVQPGATKDALLHPTVLSPAVSNKSSLLGLPSPEAPEPKMFYRCNKGCSPGGFGALSTCASCRGYITDTYAIGCPSCGGQMTTRQRTPTAGPVGQITYLHTLVIPFHLSTTHCTPTAGPVGVALESCRRRLRRRLPSAY